MTNRTRPRVTRSSSVTRSSWSSNSLLLSSKMDAEQRIKTFKLMGTVQDATIYNKTIDIEWEKIDLARKGSVQLHPKFQTGSKNFGQSPKIVQLVYFTLTCVYYNSNGNILKKSAAGELRNDYTLLQAVQKLVQEVQANIDFTVNPSEARLYRVVYTLEGDQLIDLPYESSKDTIITDISLDNNFRLQLDFTLPNFQ